MPNQQTFKVYV